MNTVCQGFAKENGIVFLPGSSWSFRGEEVPYTPYGVEKFPLGQILRKSIRMGDVTMYDLYLPLVQHPDPAAVRRVEKITGPILLISSTRRTKIFKGDRGKNREPGRKDRMDSLVKTLEFVSQ